MLAGMQLDVFTPLKDRPMTAEQLADTLGVKVEKVSPLLYARVAAEILTVQGERFANTPESYQFLSIRPLSIPDFRHDQVGS